MTTSLFSLKKKPIPAKTYPCY